MDERYTPSSVESAAQADWETGRCFEAREDSGRRKFYACSMLPYPSGKLHMGHVRNYTINDMMARQLRMKGYNVLMPMGWDAFGLPAENAAIKNNVPPARWTYENIAVMKKQMQSMGLAIDWSREIAACDPRYYKWNQWLFLKMLEQGIAYRKTQVVNWDPVDKTVLANEQVVDGKGWRTGATVEKREIPGYYLKITGYAEELLAQVVNDLEGWPDRVRAMQENWIGKSAGVRFAFTHDIRDETGAAIQDSKLWVFTTRADTIMGVTFVAVAPEHPLAIRAARSNPQVAAFVESTRQGGTTEAELALKEKEGAPTGLFVKHPLTGEQIPVWVANYVLMTYGEGAVMGVPAHDERDLAFAQKYGLPVKEIDLLPIEAATAQLVASALGEKKTTWRLRDWGISRQRYWGTPIPIIHCQDCGPVPVPYKDLPVVLPEDLVPDGSGNPLEKDRRFLACTCPKCNKPARRETDTMDTFVDSAWYFLRYCSPDSAEAMVDKRVDYWMPMDQYIGGIEHAVLHLLYARFWTKVMRDLGLVKFDEPFTRLLCQGMVLKDGAKMSKSKGNTVDPQEIIGRYGADTARLFVMFASPPEQTLEWSDAGVEGSHRFLRRVWQFGVTHEQTFKSLQGQGGELSSAARAVRREVHLNLRQADNDYTRLQYNTVVSASMKMLNALESAKLTGADAAVLHEGFSILLRVLYPATPHIAHTLWRELGYAKQHGDIVDAPWPTVDEAALTQDEIELVVQVNGKLRGNIRVSAQADRAAIEAAALADERVSKFITGTPKKVIVVPGKLVNVVI